MKTFGKVMTKLIRTGFQTEVNSYVTGLKTAKRTNVATRTLKVRGMAAGRSWMKLVLTSTDTTKVSDMELS